MLGRVEVAMIVVLLMLLFENSVYLNSSTSWAGNLEDPWSHLGKFLTFYLLG